VPVDLLTSDDLDDLGHESFRVEDPGEIVAKLVAAVDGDRLAVRDDAVYALSLAAEISERSGDLPGAVGLAERAANLAQALGPRFGHARALYGQLLLRSGRGPEGMAVLSGLRGLLTRDENAVYYVSEALEQAGRADEAVRWLTAALDTALDRRSAVAALRGSQTYQDAAVIAFALAQARHRLRRELGLPHDEHDLLADRLRNAADDIIAGDEDTYSVLVWPRQPFAALVNRWPALADVFGATWDDCRARTEQALHALAAAGQPRSTLLAGDVADLVSYLATVGGDPTDPDVMQGYLGYMEDSGQVGQEWPPQRNHPCWCGSGLKYKKCCLPRSRG
jgi:tetratricopeptide (TPR) repeat protein